jgi:hypothetical protein
MANSMKVKRVEVKPKDLLEVIKAALPDRLPGDTSMVRCVYEPTRSTIILIVTSEGFDDVASLNRSENMRVTIMPGNYTVNTGFSVESNDNV